ncbi:hypothetical protein [Bacillus cereus group sp. MYBKT111-2]|uniref:hypothetical protein n=1 Tax=Bacillus cereus group sp. MYBKT111-2 TaxID=3450598 RepID=UPI00370E9468
MEIWVWLVCIFAIGYLGPFFIRLFKKLLTYKTVRDKVSALGILVTLGICTGLFILAGFGIYKWFTYYDDKNDYTCTTCEEYKRYEEDQVPEHPNDRNNNPGVHSVKGYYRSDGTYVEGYMRSNPDGIKSNNLNPNK